MNKDFLQSVLDDLAEKRLFASFSDFRGEMNEEKIKKIQKSVKNDPYTKAAIKTGQDPEEIRGMILLSLDRAFQKLKESISEGFTKVMLPLFEEKE